MGENDDLSPLRQKVQRITGRDGNTDQASKTPIKLEQTARWHTDGDGPNRISRPVPSGRRLILLYSAQSITIEKLQKFEWSYLLID